MRASMWRSGCSAAFATALAACSSDGNLPLFEEDLDEPGIMRGQLAAYIADYDDGTSETRYFLRDAKGEERRLIVSGPIDAAPGTKIKVRGTPRTDGIELASYQVIRETVDQGTASQSLPLVDGGPTSTRILCSALVAVNGGTPNTSLLDVENAFHLGPTSINAFHLENSFRKLAIGGGSYGPYPYNMTSCDTAGIASTIRPMIDAASPVKCGQYAFILGPTQSTCGWSGLSEMGTRDAPTTDTWFNDSVSCIVTVQEPSHNYGLQHSGTLNCPGIPFPDEPATLCTHNEYGDRYDAMGSGCYHLNAWHKLYQRWFGGCNGVSTSSSGTFYLHPIETPCNGVQVLRVAFPGGRTRLIQATTLTSYYLELRTNIGFDSNLPTPQVMIHAGGAPVLPNQTGVAGLRTWLLNVGTPPTPGLVAGQSFTDAATGLTITAVSVDATRATISIDYAAGSGVPYCLDGLNSAFAPPGATSCGGAGGKGGAAGSGGAAGTGGTGAAGRGGAGGSAGAGTGGAAGTGGSATGGASGAGGTGGSGAGGGGAAGTAGTGTGGTSGSGGAAGAGASGGATGTGGAGGNAGQADAGSKGGADSGAGTGGSGMDGASRGGASGAAAMGGAGGSGTSGSNAGGSFGRDGSIAGAAGTGSGGDGLTIIRPDGACVCALPDGRASSNRGGTALAALVGIAALRRRRRDSTTT